MEIPPEFGEIRGIQELVSVPNPQDINCHKAVLYLAGLISYEELTSDSKAEREQGLDFTFGKRARVISDKEFVPISSSTDLSALAQYECTSLLPYVGQILDAEDNDMAHSFLISKRNDGFICFDKAGFKTAFSTYSLEELLNFNNYQNQLWRFLLLSEAK
jgi:hypothetical protein